MAVGTAGLEAARELGAEGIEASVLITLGTASDALNRSGFDELEQGIAIADRLNIPREFTRGHNNLAEQFVVEATSPKQSGTTEIALERMERLGIVQSVVWLLPQLAEIAFLRGEWNRTTSSWNATSACSSRCRGTTWTYRWRRFARRWPERVSAERQARCGSVPSIEAAW